MIGCQTLLIIVAGLLLNASRCACPEPLGVVSAISRGKRLCALGLAERDQIHAERAKHDWYILVACLAAGVEVTGLALENRQAGFDAQSLMGACPLLGRSRSRSKCWSPGVTQIDHEAATPSTSGRSTPAPN